MGRRAKRHRRSALQLAHPAEGIALSVAGLLVIATLWTGYQRSDEQRSTPAVPSAVPTQAFGDEDVASYPSVLLQPSPEPPVGTGVTLDPPDPQRSGTSAPAPRTPSPPATTTAPDPSPSSTSGPPAAATTPPSPSPTSSVPPTAPTAPAPPSPSPTSETPSPTAPPTEPTETPAPETPPVDETPAPDRGGATGQGQGSAPASAAPEAGPRSADPASGR